MTRADVFDVVRLAVSTFGVERTPNAGRRGKLGRDLGAEAE